MVSAAARPRKYGRLILVQPCRFTRDLTRSQRCHPPSGNERLVPPKTFDHLDLPLDLARMRNVIRKLADRLHAVEDHLTVRTQIAAAVAAMSIVLVGTLAGCAAFVSYRNTASLVNSSLAAVASATSGRLDRFMAERQLEMNLFSQLQPLQKLWRDDPAELRRALEQLQSTFSDLVWIGFADVDGKVVAATGGLLEGKSVASRPWFKEGLQGIMIGDVHEATLLAQLLAQRENGEPYRFV